MENGASAGIAVVGNNGPLGGRLFLRYTQALITQMAQTAVCNRHHSISQLICRWLCAGLRVLQGGQARGRSPSGAWLIRLPNRRTTRRSASARKNVASTLASHRHKHHAATVDAASLAPDCLAERRQFAATVLRVRFSSGYRHVAASLLLRCLPLSRACGHCVIV
ncbi:hypothetical protein ACFPTO_04130 [Paraburkholderia denitrificans]|uniref:Uncharacterized protein n=1 Tax=Paraburkholderia denitrificans TaxID=694025 RepID=A0ABW0J4V4_9BURK